MAMLVITDLSSCGQDVGTVRAGCLPHPAPTPHSYWPVLPHLDDELSEGLRNDLKQVRGILAAADVEGGHHKMSDVVQVPGGSLQGQQDENRQPVETVVHGGPREGPGQGGHVAR